MNYKTKFTLGDKVADKVSGFEGIIKAVTHWMTGCNNYGIQGRVKDDGTIPDCEWIDEGQLELTSEQVHKENKVSTGGPAPAPKQY